VIILDTNVVSEPLRPAPDPAVLAWLDRQQAATLYLTAVNVTELLAGVEALPAGKRRANLEAAIGGQVLSLFDGRILPFDLLAARAFARLNAAAQAAGQTIGFADCAIAAIAAAHGFAVATRNVRDFSATGVELINPWDTAA
jgi:predicted nucleic acid-binding protein